MNPSSPAHPASSCPSPAARWAFLLTALLLFLLVAAVFFPSIRYSYVQVDDPAYVTANLVIQDGVTLPALKSAFSRLHGDRCLYVPLLWVSYMLDNTLFSSLSLPPYGHYHLSNLLLHAFSAVLLFFLLRLLAPSVRLPWLFLLAALWALHPLRVESVAWLTERKDVLSGLFALATLLFYLLAHRTPSTSRRRLLLAASLFLCLCGALVKPSVVVIPCVLLLFDFFPLARAPFPDRPRHLLPWLRLLLEKLPFFFVAGAAALATSFFHAQMNVAYPVPLSLRLKAIAPNLLFYLQKSLLPIHLTVNYPTCWLFPWAHVLLALLLLGLLVAAAFRLRQSAPLFLVGLLTFLLFLAPTCGIVPLPVHTVADRFSYLAAIGLSVLLLPLFAISRPTLRRAAAIILPLLLLACVVLTLRQLPLWRNTDTLYANLLRLHPASPFAAQHFAKQALDDRNDPAAAANLLSPAFHANPDNWELQNLYARILARTNSPAAAIQYLASLPSPGSVNGEIARQADLANYAFAAKDYPSAIDYAQTAFALSLPDSGTRLPLLLLQMAAAHLAGDASRALGFAHRFPPYASKTSLQTSDLLPHALLQWISGNRLEALDLFRLFVQTYPDAPEILNNLVWGLATADPSPANPSEILQWARQLAALFPDSPHPGILDTLAVAQANAGDFPTAVATLDRALALFPEPATLPPDLQALRDRIASRRDLFARSLPYREPSFSRLYQALYGPIVPVQ